jgi:hypothetical protein
VTFFRGTNSESVYLQATRGSFTLAGASAITEGKGSIQRAIAPPENTQAQQREIISAQLLAGPQPFFVGYAGKTVWYRGTQNDVLAFTHPRPYVYSGFKPITVAPTPSYSLPVLSTRQDNTWALTGAAFFYYPAPFPLSFIPPSSATVLPQAPPDVPRQFTLSPPPIVQPPLAFPPMHVTFEPQIPYPGSAVVQSQPIASIVGVTPGVGKIVVRQEEPSLNRNLIASITWTQPQVQPATAPSNFAISTRLESPPEFPTSYYTPGHVFQQGRQFVLLQDAISAAVNLNYIVAQPIMWEYDPVVPYGYVVSQTVPSGTVVGYWTPISFTASLGPAQTQLLAVVPNVVGLQLWQAQTSIQGAQLVIGNPAGGGQQYVWIYSNTVLFGYVIAQSLAPGLSVPAGSTIQLTMSLGPAPVAPTETTPDFTTPPLPYTPASR